MKMRQQGTTRRGEQSSVLRIFVVLAALTTASLGMVREADAQGSFETEDGLSVHHIQGNLWLIAGAGGNITASVGPDGVLLVDSGLGPQANAVLAAINELQDRLSFGSVPPPGRDRAGEALQTTPIYTKPNPKPIRYIINTHIHADHVGGNQSLAASGITYAGGNVVGAISDATEGAAILAHENVLFDLVEADVPFEAYPTDTYFVDFMKLSHFFNGEGIRLIHMPNAHTDGDSVVHFTRSDAIIAGDIYNTNLYPVIDLANGGHIQGVIDALNDMLELAISSFRTEGGTLIVPGHGRISDSSDLGYYRDMVTIIRDHIQIMIDRGMSLEEIQAARPTRGYDPRFGADSGFWTTEMFVEAVYRNLTESGENAAN